MIVTLSKTPFTNIAFDVTFTTQYPLRIREVFNILRISGVSAMRISIWNIRLTLEIWFVLNSKMNKCFDKIGGRIINFISLLHSLASAS